MHFSISSSNPRRFSILLLIIFALIAALLFLGRFYFTQVGDLLAEKQAVAIQQASTDVCLYYSSAVGNHAAYKRALYEKRRSEVIALGSSRMLLVHEKMIRAPFTNMGRTVSHFDYLPAWLRRLEDMGPPKTIFLGLDFWWFNPYVPPRSGSPDQLQSVEVFQPWHLQGVVKTAVKHPETFTYFSALFAKPQCHLGIMAKRFKFGFDAAGYIYYGNNTFSAQGNVRHKDYRFASTIGKLRAGKGRFKHADNYSKERLRVFVAAIKRARSKGMNIYIYFPPVAPMVFAAMKQTGKFAYVDKLIHGLEKSGLKVFNFHDPATLNLGDCDFGDGFHQGDIGQARLLGRIGQSEAGARDVLNIQEIERISAMSGRVGVYQSETFGSKEVDYLGLGCKK